jgi:ABC-type dipeptide/oligopeptide/nickel transport system permease subunit
LLRLLEGGRTSPGRIGGRSSRLIGVTLGTIAGYLGGFVDGAFSRLTES